MGSDWPSFKCFKTSRLSLTSGKTHQRRISGKAGAVQCIQASAAVCFDSWGTAAISAIGLSRVRRVCQGELDTETMREQDCKLRCWLTKYSRCQIMDELKDEMLGQALNDKNVDVEV